MRYNSDRNSLEGFVLELRMGTKQDRSGPDTDLNLILKFQVPPESYLKSKKAESG